MIDGLLSGLLGGMLADPLGNYLSRFRYRTVFLGGSFLTFIVMGAIFTANATYATFAVGKEDAMRELISIEMALPLVGISLLFGMLGILLKSAAPLLTWEQVETILGNDGYVRTVSEGGAVSFTKEDVHFIARNAESSVPERIECWNRGKRKLDVILRPRPVRER
jgi:hypothetical protein